MTYSTFENRTNDPEVAVVLCAYNEAERIAGVAQAALNAPSIDSVIIVNDGSTDATETVARGLENPRLRLLNLRRNRGKGAAMRVGAANCNADILVFLDADLQGLRPEHIEALLAPVRNGTSDMAVGRFCEGRTWTDIAQRLTPSISGQRAIRREIFLQIPSLQSARYGVEMAITRFCQQRGVRTQTVWMEGVSHPMKEEKVGLLKGALSRAKMYGDIARVLLEKDGPRIAATSGKLARRFKARRNKAKNAVAL